MKVVARDFVARIEYEEMNKFQPLGELSHIYMYSEDKQKVVM